MLHSAEQLQQVQEEVHVVEVDAHGQIDRVFPGVRLFRQAEEIENEVAGKYQHAADCLDDVACATEPPENTDEAQQHESKQREEKDTAEKAEVDTRKRTENAASSHDATGSDISGCDCLPTQFFTVELYGGADNQTGDKSPAEHFAYLLTRFCGVDFVDSEISGLNGGKKGTIVI